MYRKAIYLLIPLVALAATVTFQSHRSPSAANFAAHPLPLCNDPLPMPEEKARPLMAYCEQTMPKGPPPNRAPDPVFPTGDVGYAIYGIQSGGPWPNWTKGIYQFNSTWAGEAKLVYAGALADDPNQGVVVVATRVQGTPPTKLGEYRTPTKNGALHFTAESGHVLTLTAADGHRFTFNVDTSSLAPA